MSECVGFVVVFRATASPNATYTIGLHRFQSDATRVIQTVRYDEPSTRRRYKNDADVWDDLVRPAVLESFDKAAFPGTAVSVDELIVVTEGHDTAFLAYIRTHVVDDTQDICSRCLHIPADVTGAGTHGGGSFQPPALRTLEDVVRMYKRLPEHTLRVEISSSDAFEAAGYTFHALVVRTTMVEDEDDSFRL